MSADNERQAGASGPAPAKVAKADPAAVATGGAAPTAPPPAVEAPRATEAQFLDHLKKVNDVFYDQIKIADQKAAYIFTFMVAFLITSAEGRNVFRTQRYLGDDPIVIALSGLLALAAMVTIVSAIMVVLPRHRVVSTSLYWGGWQLHRDTFTGARKSGDSAYLFDQYLGNVDALAAINRSKYRFVGFAFRALLATVVVYVLMLAYGTGGEPSPIS